MKKVTGQYQTEYVLDAKSKRSASDGDIYQVSGRSGLCVKILKNPSKTMQLDLENAMQGGVAMGVYENPMDIAYSRGKFVGYIYRGMEEPESEPITDPIPSFDEELEPRKPKTQLDGTLLDNMGFKVLITVIIGLILAVLNTKVFYWQYLEFVAGRFSTDTLSGCGMLGLSGITSTVGGIIAMVALGTAIKNSNGLLFIPLEAVAFFVGILAVDFIITIIVALVLGAISIFLAILPTIFAIALIIWIVKMFL